MRRVDAHRHARQLLFLDGVYIRGVNGSGARLRYVNAPTSNELTQLANTMARRIGHFLEQQQLMERDIENSYQAADTADEDPTSLFD